MLRLLDACCYCLEALGCLLLFAGRFWMLAVISQRLPDGCCYFLESLGCLLLLTQPSRWRYTL